MSFSFLIHSWNSQERFDSSPYLFANLTWCCCYVLGLMLLVLEFSGITVKNYSCISQWERERGKFLSHWIQTYKCIHSIQRENACPLYLKINSTTTFAFLSLSARFSFIPGKEIEINETFPTTFYPSSFAFTDKTFSSSFFKKKSLCSHFRIDCWFKSQVQTFFLFSLIFQHPVNWNLFSSKRQ